MKEGIDMEQFKGKQDLQAEVQVFDLRSKSALNAFLAKCENTESDETRIAMQDTMEIQPLAGQFSLFEAVSA